MLVKLALRNRKLVRRAVNIIKSTDTPSFIHSICNLAAVFSRLLDSSRFTHYPCMLDSIRTTRRGRIVPLDSGALLSTLTC
ncbi:hypothetical protein T4B_4852 [Trichinella pseudospiralis]|uniref:Uncharacterized protein n=1 Tax=Trichinella pseudospiralis TaxID=6337 RepID=A0A0V1JJP5_TRIPS|nr:hypothetical protein T4B_4852 [Trichinella pseudospiralis]KRZ43999.1 hypothetical protein T4C_3435 [Trichinella pseudospiralis]